jgi:hypothetical protein
VLPFWGVLCYYGRWLPTTPIAAAVLLFSGSVACLWCCYAAVYDSMLARHSGAHYWCSIIFEALLHVARCLLHALTDPVLRCNAGLVTMHRSCVWWS